MIVLMVENMCQPNSASEAVKAAAWCNALMTTPEAGRVLHPAMVATLEAHVSRGTLQDAFCYDRHCYQWHVQLRTAALVMASASRPLV